jgi:putative spermidine/putrescine transport system substrate-binding protein
MLIKPKLAVTILGALVLAACGSSPAPSASSGGPLTAEQLKGKTLIIEGWGGAWTDATKAFAEHFAKQYGVTIQYPSAPNPGTAVHLQVQSGTVQMDVVDTVSWTNFKQGDLAKFPPYLVDTLKKNIPAKCVSEYFVGCYGDTATVIGCNPDIIKKCPTNAAEFWDTTNFPGPRAMTGTTPPDAQLLIGLMAAGVPKDKLYPIDIPKAIASLQKIKPKIAVWPASGGQMQQVLIDKEVGIEYGWNGRLFSVQQKQLPNLKVSWDDSVVGGGAQAGLAVAKGAPNADVAFTFLNWWVQQADLQAEWTKTLTYPTPNTKVNALLPPNILAGMPYAPNHTQPVPTDAEYSFQHQAEIQRAFQQFLTGSS